MFIYLAFIAATAVLSYLLMNWFEKRSLLREPDKSAALQYTLRNFHFVSPQMVRKLVDSGANVNYVGKFEETPLVAALRKKRRVEVIKELITAGAGLECDYAGRQSPLVAAIVFHNQLPVVKELLNAGADPKVCLDDDGSTLLMVAAGFYHDSSLLDLLLDAGIDINARNYDGMTALMAAARFSHYPANVEKLISRGADLSVADHERKTAADYLRNNYWLKWRWRLRQLLSLPEKSISK